MKIVVNYRMLTDEVERGRRWPEKSKKRAIRAVKQVAEITRTRVLGQMPVDTGAAINRWGNPSRSDGIWRFEKEGLSHTQGARRVPYEYINRLEEGSSRQAPPGFISAIAAQAEEELDALLGGIINDL